MLQCLLHSILFNRALGAFQPKDAECAEMDNMPYVSCLCARALSDTLTRTPHRAAPPRPGPPVWSTRPSLTLCSMRV